MKTLLTICSLAVTLASCTEQGPEAPATPPEEPPTYERLSFYEAHRAAAVHYSRPTGEHALGSFDPDAIDYEHPDRYLENGPQSQLDERFVEEIRGQVGSIELDLDGLARLVDWFKREITYARDDRADRLKLSANEVYSAGTQGGCTEAALLLASVARSFGFPSVIVSTVDLEAARTTRIGEGISAGHQMVEVFVAGEWVLVDQNGWIGRGHDTGNPYLHRVMTRGGGEAEEFRGLVNSKGIDYASQGLLEDADYARQCADTIRALQDGDFDEFLNGPPLTMERYRRFIGEGR